MVKTVRSGFCVKGAEPVSATALSLMGPQAAAARTAGDKPRPSACHPGTPVETFWLFHWGTGTKQPAHRCGGQQLADPEPATKEGRALGQGRCLPATPLPCLPRAASGTQAQLTHPGPPSSSESTLGQAQPSECPQACQTRGAGPLLLGWRWGDARGPSTEAGEEHSPEGPPAHPTENHLVIQPPTPPSLPQTLRHSHPRVHSGQEVEARQVSTGG